MPPARYRPVVRDHCHQKALRGWLATTPGFETGYAPQVATSILSYVVRDAASVDAADTGTGTVIWTRTLAACILSSWNPMTTGAGKNPDLTRHGHCLAEELGRSHWIARRLSRSCQHGLVSYADIFYRSELVRGLAGAPGQLVISYDRAWRRLWTRRFADPLADAETFRIDAGGQLREIGGKARQIEDIEGQYMRLLKFTAPAWSAIEALLSTLEGAIRDRLDVTALLRRLLIGKQFPIGTFATDGQWGEIDIPEDVALYQNMVREGELLLEDALPGSDPTLG
jgi:choline kinase